jgi:hypothetical protein
VKVNELVSFRLKVIVSIVFQAIVIDIMDPSPPFLIPDIAPKQNKLLICVGLENTTG